MALDPRLTSQNIQNLLQTQRPVQNLLAGVPLGQSIAGEIQRQNILAQQAPVQQQLLEQQAQVGQLDIAMKQRALQRLGVPDEATAKELALELAVVSGLDSPESKLGRLESIRGMDSDIEALEDLYRTDPQSADRMLDAFMSAFRQANILQEDEAIAAAAAAKEKLDTKALEDNIKKEKEIFDRASKLRGELSKASDEFNSVKSAFGRVEVSADNPSPAGDLALIFNFMKMLDPGSVVREGEFANASNAGGVDSKIRNLYNQVIRGTRLEPPQRKDFLDRSRRLFDRAQSDNQKEVNKILSIGKQFGVSKENILGGEVSDSSQQEKTFTSSNGIKVTVK